MRQLLFRISDDFKFVNVSKKKRGGEKNFTRKNTREIQQKENIVVIII